MGALTGILAISVCVVINPAPAPRRRLPGFAYDTKKPTNGPSPVLTYKKGDAIDIQDLNKKWLPGTIHKVFEDDLYRVSWDNRVIDNKTKHASFLKPRGKKLAERAKLQSSSTETPPDSDDLGLNDLGLDN